MFLNRPVTTIGQSFDLIQLVQSTPLVDLFIDRVMSLQL